MTTGEQLENALKTIAYLESELDTLNQINSRIQRDYDALIKKVEEKNMRKISNLLKEKAEDGKPVTPVFLHNMAHYAEQMENAIEDAREMWTILMILKPHLRVDHRGIMSMDDVLLGTFSLEAIEKWLNK